MIQILFQDARFRFNAVFLNLPITVERNPQLYGNLWFTFTRIPDVSFSGNRKISPFANGHFLNQSSEDPDISEKYRMIVRNPSGLVVNSVTHPFNRAFL
ncbi:MAG: hypothetical protein WEB30_00885 [Cyclobacteriaceae bacterium]